MREGGEREKEEETPRMPTVRRYETADGGFVDVPDMEGTTATVDILDDHADETVPGVYLRGAVLAEEEGGWSIVSAGGLLARVHGKHPRHDHVRLRVRIR